MVLILIYSTFISIISTPLASLLLPLLSTSVKSTAKQGFCHILKSYMNENFGGEWRVYVCHVLPFLSLPLDGQPEILSHNHSFSFFLPFYPYLH